MAFLKERRKIIQIFFIALGGVWGVVSPYLMTIIKDIPFLQGPLEVTVWIIVVFPSILGAFLPGLYLRDFLNPTSSIILGFFFSFFFGILLGWIGFELISRLFFRSNNVESGKGRFK